MFFKQKKHKAECMHNITLYDNMLCNKRACGNFKLFFKRRIWLTIIVVIWILGKYMQQQKNKLTSAEVVVCCVFFEKVRTCFFILCLRLRDSRSKPSPIPYICSTFFVRCVCEQRRPRRVCAHAQTRLILRCPTVWYVPKTLLLARIVFVLQANTLKHDQKSLVLVHIFTMMASKMVY